MKFIFDVLIALFQGAYGKVLDLVKGEFAAVYIDTVEHTRRVFVAGWIAFLGVLLGVCGFLFIHIALYLYLPWSTETKALALLGLGLLYLLAAVVSTMQLLSRGFWLKHSKAEALLDSLSNKKSR